MCLQSRGAGTQWWKKKARRFELDGRG
jgi:hypothetical protein